MRKADFVRKGLAMLVGSLLLGAAEPKMELKAWAAEEPVVSDLRVAAAADGTGVAAQCSYQNYSDRSGCEIRLYLYQSEAEGMHRIAAQAPLSHAAYGMASTDFVQVPEGIYFACVVMDYSGVVRQINSQHYFKVKKTDGEYIVTREPAGEDTALSGREDAREAEEDRMPEETGDPACDHVPEYCLVQKATPVSDSVLAYQCSLCGEVLDYVEVPNSAYAAFQQETIQIINQAQTNEVIITTDRWISFHQSVLEAISRRRDVTVRVRYQYEGEMQELTIPAGVEVSNLADENGFCGFRHLDQCFPPV